MKKSEDPFVKGLSNVSNKHLKRKDSLFETFVGYFNREPHLQRLANVYPDPLDPSNLVTSFILLTRGPKSKQKFDILNSALVCFVKHHKMTKLAAGMKNEDRFSREFQSTSWDTMLKTLFLYFGEFGVLYKHPSDFTNVRGAYTALLDHKFNEIVKERVDFGSLPNRSAIDISSFHKIGIAIKEGMIKPYTVYDDLILLINFLVGVHFMLRGRAEHASLTGSNF